MNKRFNFPLCNENLKIYDSVTDAFDVDYIKMVFEDIRLDFLDCVITDDVVEKFRIECEACEKYYFIGDIKQELLGIQEYLNRE